MQMNLVDVNSIISQTLCHIIAHVAWTLRRELQVTDTRWILLPGHVSDTQLKVSYMFRNFFPLDTLETLLSMLGYSMDTH